MSVTTPCPITAPAAITTYVALAADVLVAVILGRQSLERRLDDAATETEDEVERRFLRAVSADILRSRVMIARIRSRDGASVPPTNVDSVTQQPTSPPAQALMAPHTLGTAA